MVAYLKHLGIMHCDGERLKMLLNTSIRAGGTEPPPPIPVWSQATNCSSTTSTMICFVPCSYTLCILSREGLKHSCCLCRRFEECLVLALMETGKGLYDLSKWGDFHGGICYTIHHHRIAISDVLMIILESYE